MTKQFTAMLSAYATLLEAQEKAVPVAWTLIFEESIGVNATTTFNLREEAEDYANACSMPDKCNPFPLRPTVVPLYSHPAPAQPPAASVPTMRYFIGGPKACAYVNNLEHIEGVIAALCECTGDDDEDYTATDMLPAQENPNG